MESKINGFGILDFFKAFSSDTSIDGGRVNMRDLKASDWDGVPEVVKKELLVESPKRIQRIFKSIVTKINDTLNVKTSTRKNVNVKENSSTYRDIQDMEIDK